MKTTEVRQATSAPPLRTLALAALAELVPADATHEPVATLLLQARAQLPPPGWPAALQTLCSGALPPARGDERLLQLVQGLGLHPIELLAAATALAAQLDPAAARAVAWLQGSGFDNPGAAALPSLGLLAAAGTALLAPDEPADTALLQLLHGPAAQAGLWVAGPAEVPSQRSVQLPALLLPWLRPGPRAPVQAEVHLAPSQWQVLQAAVAPLQAGRAVLLRCASDEEGQACAARLAQALGRPLLPLSGGFSGSAWPEGAALLARAGLVLPVLNASATPLPSPEGAPPLLVLAGPEGAVSLPGRRLVELRVPLPSVAERAAHWAQLGWSEPQALAQRSRCGLTQVQHLHEAAQLHAATRGEPTATPADVLHAQASAAAAAFEGLGQLIPTAQAPQLVLTAANQQALQQLLARCRVRERLHDHAQHSARAAVCALFSGPSGTGKTLAASWLAAQLHLPLVAIDLAALTSKWIGETEKNLSQVFSRAEGLGVVLLFDEADALFGARTDTHSSNDRFANQQTNYLLSRLERFDGIAVLTSNARQRLDGAFARRIDALVEFRQPGVEERRALWALHLGPSVPEAWLDRLASLVELPGGHVRAAALYAQALALDAGRALAPQDLLAGLQSEHAKLDRSVAPELLRPWH